MTWVSSDRRTPLESAIRAYSAAASKYCETHSALPEIETSLLSKFAGVLQRDSTVVDAGCGSGLATEWMKRNLASVVGLDLAGDMLRAAHERMPDDWWVLGDARRLPFRDGSVDGYIAWYSLIHMHHPGLQAAISEAGRVLTEGGICAVALHETMASNPRGQSKTELLSTRSFLDSGIPMALRLISLKEITTCLMNSGLRVLDIRRRAYNEEAAEVPTNRLMVLASKEKLEM